MAQIYYDALGKHGAMGFIAFLFIVQYMMGLSITVAASRQMWAFSRDGALPFSPFFRPIVRNLEFPFLATKLRTNNLPANSPKDSDIFPSAPYGEPSLPPSFSASSA